MFEVADVLRQAARSGHDERPCQFGWRNRRAGPFGYRDAVLSAGVDIDMRTDTPRLHHQFELGQFFNQLAWQMGALADEHNHIGILQPYR